MDDIWTKVFKLCRLYSIGIWWQLYNFIYFYEIFLCSYTYGVETVKGQYTIRVKKGIKNIIIVVVAVIVFCFVSIYVYKRQQKYATVEAIRKICYRLLSCFLSCYRTLLLSIVWQSDIYHQGTVRGQRFVGKLISFAPDIKVI